MVALAVLALLVPAPVAWGHGGGGGGGGHGGGGHGGGHYVYIPGFYTQGQIEVPPAEIGSYDKIHTIGVVSAIGGSARLFRHNGFLNSTTVNRDISAWNMDGIAFSALDQLLSSRFKLIDIPVNHKTIADAINPGLLNSNTAPLTAYLRGLKRDDVDAFLVVRPVSTNLDPGGAGLDLELAADQPTVWANYELVLIDAKTFQQIAKAFSRVHMSAIEPTLPPGVVFFFPFITDEKITLSELQPEQLRKMFSTALQLSLVETVRSLRFDVPLPRPGGRLVLPTPRDRDPYRNISTVAVVSGVGDQLQLAYRGTLFRHHMTSVPTPDSNLDDTIETQVSQILSKRFEIKKVPVDRAKLASTVISGIGVPPETHINGLTANAGVDAYVVIVKHQSLIGRSFDEVSGLGVWRNEPFGSTYTGAFANYMVLVIDGHTLSVMRSWLASSSPAWTDLIDYQTIDDKTWPDNDKPSSQQLKTIRAAEDSILSDSLPETLYRIGLTGYQDGPLLSALPGTGPKGESLQLLMP